MSSRLKEISSEKEDEPLTKTGLGGASWSSFAGRSKASELRRMPLLLLLVQTSASVLLLLRLSHSLTHSLNCPFSLHL